MQVFAARVDGEAVRIEVTAEALVVRTARLNWVDCDVFEVTAPTVRLATFDGVTVAITHLATTFDRFVTEVAEARGRARRAALLQWTGDREIDVFDAKRGVERVRVHLFDDALTVEPATGVPDMVPLSCLTGVERAGYALTLRLRGLDDVQVRHFGNRTDEFLQRLGGARRDLAARTAAVYAGLDPALADLDAADGWAVDEATAGALWDPLRAAVCRGRRADELEWLSSRPDARVRLGIKCGPGDQVLPFGLVSIAGRIVVEATDADDRATFVFDADDAERLNAALLSTSFRREAITVPEAELGRWALAVRTLAIVRWARRSLAARVVHDGCWQTAMATALGR